ncbi:MAG: glutamate racemase [Spirochaetaceae bacterium]|jgi:glutamate racemase|nr:glutamate racemase [Spirochaetaceae bacterium]
MKRDEGPVLFLDSGIGGLPYLRHFRERNPDEDLVYAADRRNFPYGSKDKDTLTELLSSLLLQLIRISHPKLAVLACNTASVSALESLRKAFPSLPFVGTVPAVKPAVLNSRTGLAGVLGTERTIADEYIQALAKKINPACRVMGAAAPELVEFVEHVMDGASKAERLDVIRPYVEKFRVAGADSIVLGCTHFLFLLDEFRELAGKDMTVYDSISGVASRAESLLSRQGLRRGGGPHEKVPRGEGPHGKGLEEGPDGGPGEEGPGKKVFYGKTARCFLTGGEEPGAAWEKRAEAFGLSVVLLDRVCGEAL